MSGLTLEQARAILDGALASARSRQAEPLAVVVLDAGGHTVTLAREDGATFLRARIARAKAYGALGMGADTQALAERAKGNPVFFAGLVTTVAGALVYSPGGVLIRQDGRVIGAVGISGDTGPVDAACAAAGIAAAGLSITKGE